MVENPCQGDLEGSLLLIPLTSSSYSRSLLGAQSHCLPSGPVRLEAHGQSAKLCLPTKKLLFL